MKTFLYDGTFEGLLTAIYDSFYSKVPPIGIFKSENYSALLLDEIIYIKTDEIKAKKVMNAIITKIDSKTLQNLYIVFLSNNKDAGTIALKYTKTAFKLGKDIHAFLNLDIVKMVEDIRRMVYLEAHRFEGFIRFSLIENKFLYSSIEPDNDILELIAPHFSSRFSNEYFIIHDINREKALIYNKRSWEITHMTVDDYNLFKSTKDEYVDLWKCYFESTTINERKNPKLQKRMMPIRYWKHLSEFQ